MGGSLIQLEGSRGLTALNVRADSKIGGRCAQRFFLGAMYEFAKAKELWYKTWPEDVTRRSMAV